MDYYTYSKTVKVTRATPGTPIRDHAVGWARQFDRSGASSVDGYRMRYLPPTVLPNSRGIIRLV